MFICCCSEIHPLLLTTNKGRLNNQMGHDKGKGRGQRGPGKRITSNEGPGAKRQKKRPNYNDDEPFEL